MNNLQYIVKDNTRFAMHVAVELCEQGEFDSPYEAIQWLMQERDDDLVRCRNCRSYEPNIYSNFTCELLLYRVEPNDFCAWGERKEDDER